MNKQTTPAKAALPSIPGGSGKGASIEARGLTKVYGKGPKAFHALGPIDIDIKPGEFVSLIGPSGCGKSTMMLLVSGLEPISEGKVVIDGTPLTRPISEVGIVFQDHLLLDFRTALKNVMLQQEIRGLDKALMQERAALLFSEALPPLRWRSPILPCRWR